jgi:hypothetical protein
MKIERTRAKLSVKGARSSLKKSNDQSFAEIMEKSKSKSKKDRWKRTKKHIDEFA